MSFFSALISASPPPIVDLTIWARLSSLVGNDKEIWYRVNGGSWTTGGTITSTVCADIGYVPSLTSGDVVDIVTIDASTSAARSIHCIEAAAACAATGGVEHSDDTSGGCGGDYFTVTMGASNREVSIYISNNGCL